jgi:PAS domain-containing protein
MQSLPTVDDTDKEPAPSALESVNEQLEKAIEQLRQANEALQLTADALGTLNSQLETMHEEVEDLSQEVVRLRESYVEAFDHVPCPVLLVDKAGRIEAWNTAAQQLFHLPVDISAGIDLSEFPVPPGLGRKLSRKHRAVLEGGTSEMLRNQLVQGKRAIHIMDVHFASLSRDRLSQAVVMTFVSSPAREEVVTLWERSGTRILDGAAS